MLLPAGPSSLRENAKVSRFSAIIQCFRCLNSSQDERYFSVTALTADHELAWAFFSFIFADNCRHSALLLLLGQDWPRS